MNCLILLMMWYRHLGSQNAISHVHKILEEGTGADRQLKVFEETQSLPAVVDYIHSQFLAGL